MKTLNISIPENQLVEVAAALLARQALTQEDDLEFIIKTCVDAIPDPFKVVYIKTTHKTTGNPLQVKCTVTKMVVREKGDEFELVSFEESPACIAEWDDTEIDCASIRESEVEAAWENFLDSVPEYEDYEDMIKKFIIMNYSLFAGRKLILAITENEVGCRDLTSYSLLDTKPTTRTIRDVSFNEAVTPSLCQLNRKLRRRVNRPIEEGEKTQLKLLHSETSRLIKSLLKK